MNYKQLIKAIQSVIGKGEHLLHQPLIIGNEQEYVSRVIASGHLSAGEWVNRFEQAFAARIHARHAIAVMNGTCGLHAIITAMPKIKEYRMPSLTFVASANAVAYGGNNIRFVDYAGYCDLAIDILGHPHPNVGASMKDAAQSLGSKHHGEYIGSSGTCVFSFNQNKIISTGGGGMVVTDNAELAETIRHLVTTARVAHKWECAHNAVAFNYRMSDISAAIGVAQLEQFSDILKAKRALAAAYIEVLADVPGISVLREPPKAESNYWLNAIRLNDAADMEPLLIELHDAGIQARRMWTPAHQLPMYEHFPRDDMRRTDAYFDHVICLPSSPKLGLRFM